MKKLILLVAMTFALPCFAISDLEGTSWKTEYISGHETFQVHFMENDRVELSIDPNSCSLNDLGEPTVCTVMGVERLNGQLVGADISTDRRTLVYDFVLDENKGQSANFRLVTTVPFQACGSLKLLVLNQEGQTIDSHILSRNGAN